MNKARIAVLAILTLSVINLCFMIFSNLVGMRAFPDYSPMVMTLFNVFLMTLGLLSVWQRFTGIGGHAMRGKILLLLAVEFFVARCWGYCCLSVCVGMLSLRPRIMLCKQLGSDYGSTIKCNI